MNAEFRNAEQNKKWVQVVGWEGFYIVSNHGDVARFGGRVLKPIKKKALGYLCVTLHKPGTKKRQALIQTLVLESFIGPRPAGFDGCHNNGIRDDNRLENLRWASRADNQADKTIHGTSLKGEKSPFAKLTAEKVLYVRSSPKKQQELADELGVSQVLISKIRLRKTWTHI